MIILCMIPVRLGSQRIKSKNIRYLGDKPLAEHIIETVKLIPDFRNNIFLNASEEIFESIAKRTGIKFHRRPPILSEPTASNDDFVYEFLKCHECDWVVQAHSTSPFTSISDILNLLEMIKGKGKQLDAIFSVKERKSESIYEGKPINWIDRGKMMPTQELEPILTFTNGLMAFKRSSFIKYYEELGYALFAGNKDYFKVTGASVIDLDDEQDFRVAEGVYESRRKEIEPLYYSNIGEVETSVSKVLKDDGVPLFLESESSLQNIYDIINSMPIDYGWSVRMINTPSNSATLICQFPEEGNRMHYHYNWDEWWIILEGNWKLIEDGKEKILHVGDIVELKRGVEHEVRVIGNKRGIRFAISRDDIPHIYKHKSGE